MTYQELMRMNADLYLKHVPRQDDYKYTRILIGTSIMELLAVIADELHGMNKQNDHEVDTIPIEWIEKQIDKGKWKELVQRWREL